MLCVLSLIDTGTSAGSHDQGVVMIIITVSI